MQKRIILSSHGLSCEIRGSSSLIEAIRKDRFTYHYMISAQEVQDASPDIIVALNNRANPIQISYPHAQFNERLSPRDVVVLGEYLLERARQERKGYYTVSSACAANNNGAVIFYGGATNLGKTSSMMTLVKEGEFTFISDEKTLIDLEHRTVPGGSPSIPTRKKRIRDLFFKGKTLKEYEEFQPSTEKRKVGLMIYPHLDHGLKKPIFYKWKPLDFFWLLTRDLSHEIRGGIRLVDKFSHLLPCIDTERLTSLRVARTKLFTDQVPCYYFQGSLEQVAEYIPHFLEIEKC